MPRRRPPGRPPGPHFNDCTVCQHPERARLEHLKARGASFVKLGEMFGLSPSAVRRHWTRHVSAATKAAELTGLPANDVTIEKLIDEENIGLLQHLQRIRAGLYSLFDAAVEVGDGASAAPLAGKLHENLRLAAQKTGELEQTARTSITNFVVSQPYIELRGDLLTILHHHPEAKAAVLAAFAKAERPLIDHVAAE